MKKEKGLTFVRFVSILIVIIFGLFGILVSLKILGVLDFQDSDSKNVLVQESEEDVKSYYLEELIEGHLFRVVGLVLESRMVYRTSMGVMNSVYNFGDSLTEGLKELAKRGYFVKNIKEIRGNFGGASVTKDLLVFVEPLDKGLGSEMGETEREETEIRETGGENWKRFE